eukprot:GSChrysophyteH1.ASY1.ANO1.2862.1 assembled CDS
MANRTNPMTDKFDVKRFHHVEFYCSDSTQAANRFTWGFGMPEVARSDMSTGNLTYASKAVQSGELVFCFTAAYSNEETHAFVAKHGLAVHAVGIRVADAKEAHDVSVANGGVSNSPPRTVVDTESGKSMTISEIKYFGDVVLRFVSGDFTGPMLPNYKASPTAALMDGPATYGLHRLDHIVSNVPDLFAAQDFMMQTFGFHEFSEFTAEDVGTVDSGLNSMVFASNNEFVLLPVNEPTFGTRRKSQIQTYLEHNNGSGIQHMALMTDDIFSTMREMRKRSRIGGFELLRKMPGPNWADRDDQGILLQVFTKPLGDRPTVFCEIIQRIGSGCGGFGKGNFSELFKSIEEFEKTIEAKE